MIYDIYIFLKLFFYCYFNIDLNALSIVTKNRYNFVYRKVSVFNTTLYVYYLKLWEWKHYLSLFKKYIYVQSVDTLQKEKVEISFLKRLIRKSKDGCPRGYRLKNIGDRCVEQHIYLIRFVYKHKNTVNPLQTCHIYSDDLFLKTRFLQEKIKLTVHKCLSAQLKYSIPTI
jgi:hypothetical protein